MDQVFGALGGALHAIFAPFGALGSFIHDAAFVPIVNLMGWVLTTIHHYIPSYGLSLIVLAVVVRIVLYPFSQAQFKSMAEMQKLQPLTKKLQAKFKGDAQKIQVETMSLYREHGVNPLAGCLPAILPLPILLSLYWTIINQKDEFAKAHFLWLGSPLSDQFPKIFATSLATTDMVLLGLYVVSMYLSVRYGSPPTSDPQQAQTQKIMAVMSPVMIAYCGFTYHWASALILYWLSTNILTMGQQFFLYRKYGLVGPRAVEARAAAEALAAKMDDTPVKNVTAKGDGKSKDGKGGSSSKKSKGSPNGRAYKRGAKR